jgi:hypothetical protein
MVCLDWRFSLFSSLARKMQEQYINIAKTALLQVLPLVFIIYFCVSSFIRFNASLLHRVQESFGSHPAVDSAENKALYPPGGCSGKKVILYLFPRTRMLQASPPRPMYACILCCFGTNASIQHPDALPLG